MLKQIGKIAVNKIADYNDSLIKALEKDGFTAIKVSEVYSEAYYIIAKPEQDSLIVKSIGGADK